MRAVHKEINPTYKNRAERMMVDYSDNNILYLQYTRQEYLDKFMPKDIEKYLITEGELVNVNYAEFTGVLLDKDGNYHKYSLSEIQVITDTGNISDGYHTFKELYEYRLLYNAAFFNELARRGVCDVHKSKRHSDGKIPFENPNWFIVVAELPTGQISNHYEMKDWDLFQVPEKDISNVWDGHGSRDVAKRIRKYLENHDEDTTISNNQ